MRRDLDHPILGNFFVTLLVAIMIVEPESGNASQVRAARYAKERETRGGLVMEEFVKVFRALAEPNRQHIVKLLAGGSMYVCQLEEVLQIGQSNVSQHLRVLKEARLVREEKQGWWTLYHLDRTYVDEVFNLFRVFLDQPPAEVPGWNEIANRLAAWEADPPILSCRPKQPRRKGKARVSPGDPGAERPITTQR